jgi:hypothetical protein
MLSLQAIAHARRSMAKKSPRPVRGNSTTLASLKDRLRKFGSSIVETLQTVQGTLAERSMHGQRRTRYLVAHFAHIVHAHIKHVAHITQHAHNGSWIRN